MYNINYKNIKKGNLIPGIILVVGLIVLVILLGIYISFKNKEKMMDSWVMSYDVSVQSHYDDEGSILYSPVYYYDVNGTKYECRSNSSSSIYPSTDNKVVYYEKDNPANCISDYSKKTSKVILACLIIPTILIGVSVYLFVKTAKRINKVKELNQKGKLIKGLPYQYVASGISVNGYNLPSPVVEYTLPTGETVSLKGEPRYDYKNLPTDSVIDLLIDENNPDNYFIDFNIAIKES